LEALFSFFCVLNDSIGQQKSLDWLQTGMRQLLFSGIIAPVYGTSYQ
jgi:hypothetical protein